ncbi:5'-nucleotidase, partial [Pseudovirgaria hyperparasitica]
MAAGTIRGDQIYPPGVLRLKDIMNCFPFEDPVVVINVTGQAILEALENSVSKFPALEGRFPQVSNIEFEFHPEKPEGSRIISCEVAGGPLDKDRVYKLATRGYMARGKDGYDSLLIEAEGGKAVEIVSEENGVLISTLLRQYFMSLKVLGKWKMWGPSMGRHWHLQAKHPHMEPQSPTDDVLGAFESFEAERTN